MASFAPTRARKAAEVTQDVGQNCLISFGATHSTRRAVREHRACADASIVVSVLVPVIRYVSSARDLVMATMTLLSNDPGNREEVIAQG